MSQRDRFFTAELDRRGVTRSDFLAFVTGVTGLLALPPSASGAILRALTDKPKPTLVWLQDCARNPESFLRASRPSTAEVVLDLLSVDYHETLTAAAGAPADENRARRVRDLDGHYIAVVEGAIPIDGAYCAMAADLAREVCRHALATIAVGTCAAFGGLRAAAPNPTGALGVADAVPGLENLIHLPACPINADNLVALVAYYVTYGRFPPLDRLHRPLFAHGKAIHDVCKRRAHFDASQSVDA